MAADERDEWSGDDDREGAFVETYTGERFYPFDPRPSEVRLADVAQGLANTCRFGGQCRSFYSVARHSVLVGRELAAGGHGPRVQSYGLLHDAGEAYMADLPRPVKAAFPSFERAEERVREAVLAAVELPPPRDAEWEAVTAADDRLLHYEAGELLADGSWAGGAVDLGYDLRGGSPDADRERFLDRAGELLERA